MIYKIYFVALALELVLCRGLENIEVGETNPLYIAAVLLLLCICLMTPACIYYLSEG